MNQEFHYYATYCAAILAGYSHRESLEIGYSACLVDYCTRTFLSKIKAPSNAATSQLQLELVDARTDIIGLQDITRIWSSFHFLPYDLNAQPKKRCSGRYRQKYSLICGPNGELVRETVRLAKGKNTQSAGIAMHVLADTWVHRYFAGTPSLVINNTNAHFFELFRDGDTVSEKKITFRHSAGAPDDLDKSIYTCSLNYNSEKSIMVLGHGRAGHLPDYSFARYKYLPAWGEYEEIVKDNPSDFEHAFRQMVYAMKYLRGDDEDFECNRYDTASVDAHSEQLKAILTKRQLSAESDWIQFAAELSGIEPEPFSTERYQEEYLRAEDAAKDETFLGKFILGALAQKSMVTHQIYLSGNKLAGYSVEYQEKGFRGIRDFRMLLRRDKGGHQS